MVVQWNVNQLVLKKRILNWWLTERSETYSCYKLGVLNIILLQKISRSRMKLHERSMKRKGRNIECF